MKVAVIGAGSWGTALAQVLGCNGHDVRIWARREEVVESINTKHRNPRYLVDSDLSERIVASTSHEYCVEGAQAVVVVTPSSLLRQVAQTLAGLIDRDIPVVICSKGVEAETSMLAVEVFEQEMGNVGRLAVLSGPNHAEEVIRWVPSATVIASSSADTANFFQELFASPTFRVYTSSDVIGVEVCAASKNVIAIAVGISYGCDFGDNTCALLMTRGQAEMSRLVCALGGDPITCMGLAGTGDLIATCMSRHSRNRRFGEMVAKGEDLDDFTQKTHMVAEGALACKTLLPLAEKAGVELPITQTVKSIVWDRVDVSEIASKLLSRPLREEFYGLE